MDTNVGFYCAYIAISVLLVVFVGRSLFRNGAVFLQDVFRGEEELAEAVNRLLLAGFYLVNLGLVLLTSTLGTGTTSTDLFRTLTVKLGLVSLVLGTMHFINLAQLSAARRRRQEPRRQPAPDPRQQQYPYQPQA